MQEKKKKKPKKKKICEENFFKKKLKKYSQNFANVQNICIGKQYSFHTFFIQGGGGVGRRSTSETYGQAYKLCRTIMCLLYDSIITKTEVCINS